MIYVGCFLVLHTRSNWNGKWSLCYIMDTCKVNLSPLWISWLILDYCVLSKIIVAPHWGDVIRQTSKCFEFFPYSQKRFPTTIWVKAYLGGTIKNHPPQNHKNFLGLRCLYSKSMQNYVLVFISLIDLVSQLQTCFGTINNFVNGIFFLPCI
jgi:hypothetical protein